MKNKINSNRNLLKKIGITALIVLVAASAAVGGWFAFRSFFSRAGTEKIVSQAEFKLESTKTSIEIDEELEVDLMVNVNQTIESPVISAYMEFDKSVLELVSVTPNTDNLEGNDDPIFEQNWVPSGWTVEKANQEGKLVAIGMTKNKTASSTEIGSGSESSGLDWFNGTGRLATMKFKGLKAGTANLSFTNDKSAVMQIVAGDLNEYGQPKNDPKNILKNMSGYEYAVTVGDGGVVIPAPVLTATVNLDQPAVDLSWTFEDSTIKEVSYKIYRKLGTDSQVTDDFELLTEELKEKQYIDQSVEDGKTYTYYVVAVVANETSKDSNHETVTIGETTDELYADIADKEGYNPEGDGVVDSYDFDVLKNNYAENWDTKKEAIDFAKRDDNNDDVSPKSDGKVDLAEFVWMMSEWNPITN